ncbi:hypothetical protein [Priestia endophytica]|uniref:hypothetical protein n=1 Tax=Priestia endophytica TaxID=135735 RepID=UPI00227EE51F|nr:hypothetical protein [Priestia endophytica]MCY8231657.1 hypothetical protein [Priestia endophytica]
MAVFKVDTDALSNLSKSVSDQKQTIEGLSKKYTTLISHTNKIIDNGPYAIPNAGTVQNTNEAINAGHTNVVKHYSQTIENISSIVIQAKIADFLATSFPPSLDSLNPLKVMKDFISDKLGFLFDGEGKTKEEKLMEGTFGDITPKEYGLLSNLAYRNTAGIQRGLESYNLDGKFEVVKVDNKSMYHYESGLDVVVFRQIDTNNEIVVFRGTEPPKITVMDLLIGSPLSIMRKNRGTIKDIREDVTGVLGVGTNIIQTHNGPVIVPVRYFHPSKQIEDARKFMEKYNEFSKSNTHVSFSGHSLGGNIATTMADEYRKTAVTFNAPRFHEDAKPLYLKNNNQSVINFKTEGDAVSEEKKGGVLDLDLDYAPGVTLEVPNVGEGEGLSAHGMMSNFHFNNKGDILIKEGQGNLYGTKSLTSSVVTPNTVGNLRALDKEGKRPIEAELLAMNNGKEKAISLVEEAINGYKELGDYKSISGEYGKSHKEFDGKEIDKQQKEIRDKMKKIEEEISEIKEETKKQIREKKEQWENSSYSTNVVDNLMYEEGGYYQQIQERKQKDLREELAHFKGELEILDFKEKKGYDSPEGEILEKLIRKEHLLKYNIKLGDS